MRILITGGAASGKSSYAEERALEMSAPHVYLATMQAHSEEDALRVQRHQAMRAGKGFITLEFAHADEQSQLLDFLPEQATVLLEDLGNLVSNALFDADGTMRDESCAYQSVRSTFALLADNTAHLIVVGNEVGMGVEQQTPELQTYIRLLGRVACEYAASCDEVVELACGIPRRIK